MSESYTQTCTSYYGGPSDRATACKVCRRSAGPDLWCRRCRAGEIQYGEGFMERGERAARVYREARRVLEGMHPYSNYYDGKATEARIAHRVMRGYGFQIDDEQLIGSE